MFLELSSLFDKDLKTKKLIKQIDKKLSQIYGLNLKKKKKDDKDKEYIEHDHNVDFFNLIQYKTQLYEKQIELFQNKDNIFYLLKTIRISLKSDLKVIQKQMDDMRKRHHQYRQNNYMEKYENMKEQLEKMQIKYHQSGITRLCIKQLKYSNDPQLVYESIQILNYVL